MSKIKFKSNHTHRFFLEITPLVDMVFLLVAFFLLNSSLEKISSINIDLPSAEQSGQAVQSDLIIRIDSQNIIYFNDKKIEISGLKELIDASNLSKDNKIIIEGDKASSYDAIISVIDYLGKNGISNFVLSTKQK